MVLGKNCSFKKLSITSKKIDFFPLVPSIKKKRGSKGQRITSKSIFVSPLFTMSKGDTTTVRGIEPVLL